MNFKRILLFAATVMTSMQFAHAGLPNTNNPVTFLGPVFKASYTGHIYHHSAFSVLGEAGTKNLRIGGTLGAQLEDDQFLKLSAEYLYQKVTYGFLTGNTSEWVSQMALGAGYEYDMFGEWDPRFGIDGYVSYAPSKSLSNGAANILINGTTPSSFTENRRVAGSVAAGVSPGFSVLLWDGGRGKANFNYDNVRYDNSYNKKQHAIGVGGTVGLTQDITDDINLNLSAAVRAPFNNYQAGLTFSDVPYFDDWTLGLGGSYVAGKATLPNTWNVLLTADYQAEEVKPAQVHRRYKDGVVNSRYKDSIVTNQQDDDRLVAWTSVPAVYMPQVLAVVDSFSPQCGGGVSLTGVPLPSLVLLDPPITTIQSAPSFSANGGSGLTFSLSTDAPITDGTTLTINPTTGVLTLTPGASQLQIITYHVTATNACGQSVTATAVINLTVTV